MNYIDVKNFRKYEKLFGDNGPAKIGHVNAVIKALNEATSGGGSAYKVYTALLTQSGGQNTDALESGNLIIGVTYRIQGNSGDSDWTNVGAPNNNIDTWFVATGTTPNSWGSAGSLSFDLGAPVVTVLENTLDDIVYFLYDDIGSYAVKGVFPENKTVFVVSNIGNVPSDFISIRAYIDVDNIYISTTSMNFIGTSENLDNILLNTPIEIRVYY